MNRIYRSIWNEATGTAVAVSENASSAGKKPTACTSVPGQRQRFTVKLLAASLCLAFGACAYALPQGGVVAAGAADIASSGATTTITQSTANAVINWQSFSIATGQTVQFVQPSVASVALNRVVGPDPSSIFGNLSSNGKVFLVNPNGILFGAGSSVNVGGLVASTLNISDANFMKGNYIFNNPGSGAVVNEGTINADGGYVALLGARVNNLGLISARMGTVALAAGNAITLDVAGDRLLNVTVDQGAVNALVENGGLIQSDGGTVLLTAQAAGNLLSTVVNNTGVIRAQTLSSVNGTIKLLGDMQSGTVNVSGTLDASGGDAGQTGGSVTATAHHVGLFGAHVDASGDAGGGTVLVGGGYQGNNPSVQNASATYMSADSSIHVDAVTTGSGGTAVLWSADSTRAYGSITARGGALAGNGGAIETSSHWLDVAGMQVDASARSGKSGMWLLDPADITIGLGATTGATLTAGVFTPDSGVSTSHINVNQLANTLGVGGAGTDVTITTTNSGAAGGGAGDITIESALSWSPTAPTTLTLTAARDVNINASVTTVRGNLVVCCGRDVNVNAPISTTNGSVLLSGGRDVNIVRSLATALLPSKNLAGLTTTNGNIMVCAANDINLGNTFDGFALVTLTSGSATAGESLSTLGVPRGLSLRAGNGATGPGAANGTVKIAAGTILTVTGPAGVSPIDIVYNPTSYLVPTDYSGFFATGNGAPLTQRMLVFPSGADKVFDGTTTASFTTFKTDAAGNLPGAGTLTLVQPASGTFSSAAVGTGKLVTYSGLTLGGASAGFALPADCCGSTIGTGRTTANITAAIPPVVPAAIPPVVPAAVLQLAGVQLATFALAASGTAASAFDALTLSDAGPGMAGLPLTDADPGLAGLPLTVTSAVEPPMLTSLAPTAPVPAPSVAAPVASPQATPALARYVAPVRKPKQDRH